MKLTRLVILGFMAITAATAAANDAVPSGRGARDNKALEVESILDRLEKKLTDNEGGGLTFGERLEPATSENGIPKATNSYKFDKDAGAAATGTQGGDDPEAVMKNLAEVVAGLEVQVERLHADVQKARLKVIEDSRFDSFVQIDGEFRGMETATLKGLVVKIDGVEVYRASDSGGLWVPTSKLPLYSGPVPPGTHKLSVEAGILVREGPQVPVSADVTRRLEKDFEFTIPDGKERRSVRIVIEAPARPDVKGNITMSSSSGTTGGDGVKL